VVVIDANRVAALSGQTCTSGATERVNDFETADISI
jgi:hypothetical protein